MLPELNNSNYCKCGSLKIKDICTNRGCMEHIREQKTIKNTRTKRNRWKIGDEIVFFNQKLTYKEALQSYQEIHCNNKNNKCSSNIYYY